MALTVTLTSLTNQVRLLADNHRLTDAQLALWINQGWTMLYDRLVETVTPDYYLNQTYFPTSSASTYPLSLSATYDTGSVALFTAAETVTGGTSGATATVYQTATVTVSGTLVLGSRSLTAFTALETITGGTSGATARFRGTNGGCGAPDFYKLRGLDVQYQGTQFLPLKPFIWKDRNAYTNAYATFGQFPGTYLRYRLQGNNVVFTPTPTGANLIRLSYVPAPTLLVNATDTIDGVAGWEQYIVNHAAIQCLINEETDASQIMAQQAQLEQRIVRMAQERDKGEPARVAAASDCDDFPFGFGGW